MPASLPPDERHAAESRLAAAMVVLLLAVFVGLSATALLTSGELPASWSSVGQRLAMLGVAWLPTVLAGRWWWHRRVRWHRALRGRCFHCGYDLRYRPGPRCPDCGHPRDPAWDRPR